MPKPLPPGAAGDEILAHKRAVDVNYAASYLDVSTKSIRRRIADAARIPGRSLDPDQYQRSRCGQEARRGCRVRPPEKSEGRASHEDPAATTRQLPVATTASPRALSLTARSDGWYRITRGA